jgi:hypothetical protein
VVTDVARRPQRPSPAVELGRTRAILARSAVAGIRVRSLSAVLLVSIPVMSAVSASSYCPSPDAIEGSLRQLNLFATYRTEELGQEPPWSLYRKAAKDPGRVVVDRHGNLGQAVLISTLPIEDLWMAINDEDHYAEGGYLPVEHSAVVGGTSRGQQRLLFQYFRRAGIGRWWIDEVVMNRELFEASEGLLWELRWWDLMESHAESGPPAAFVGLDLAPIEESRGAWLLIPLGDSCTLVEYATLSRPGGLLNLAQVLGSRLVIRETLEGTERLAREHIPQPHPGARFVKPDGTPIGQP